MTCTFKIVFCSWRLAGEGPEMNKLQFSLKQIIHPVHLSHERSTRAMLVGAGRTPVSEVLTLWTGSNGQLFDFLTARRRGSLVLKSKPKVSLDDWQWR